MLRRVKTKKKTIRVLAQTIFWFRKNTWCLEVSWSVPNALQTDIIEIILIHLCTALTNMKQFVELVADL